MNTCLSKLPSGGPVAGVFGRAVRGHLELRSDLRDDGVTYLSHQSFRAPIHLGKAHADAGAAIVHLVNPTAGFFDGDRMDLRIVAGTGSRLVLSAPGASRVHRARSSAAAVCEQTLRVEAGASVEWIPEPFIPQADARYVQRTRIDLAADASLLYFEWVAPGRVAHGEIFAYERLRWEMDLVADGVLIARERYDLTKDGHQLEALRAKFAAAHYFAVYAAGEFAVNWPGAEIDALGGEDVYLGHGPLVDGQRVIRALCRDSLATRSLLEALRAVLYQAAGRRPPRLGRIFM
jgi:urease accessory protein